MYKGMNGKFVIIVTGFIIIFRALKPVMMEALLAGFVTVQLMAWIYPLLMMRRKKQA
jgi:F0F1-type ATP synthase assembly protein I